MSRKYSDIAPSRKYIDWRGEVRMTTPQEHTRRGLKLIHIGDGVWRIGRERILKGTNVLHQVIYAPDGTEHHIYDDVVRMLSETKHYEGETGRWVMKNKQHNHADQAKVKIYILTHILDKPYRWCFDLKQIPPVGKLKVIYSNGTVKNIDFDGTFQPVKIGRWGHTETPVAYRTIL